MLVDPPADLTRHRRVVVHGVTGSGKSTLAARLSKITGIPHVSIDDLMWRPGWVQLDPDQQVEAIRPHAEAPEWVVDGLWTAARPLLLPRADLLVTLDHPRQVSLGRLVTRTLRRLRTGEEFCGGNTEQLRRALSSDSILAWHQRSYARKSAESRAWAQTPGVPPVVRFTAPAAVEAWLRILERSHT